MPRTDHNSCLVAAPLPDECLYSIAAHHTERWHGGTARGTRTVLGHPTILARDVIGNLRELAGAFGALPNLTAEALALDHTALPVFLPFSDRTDWVECACSSGSLQLRLGIAASRLASARALRFCPECAKSDRATFGRAYWHREHQLAGMLVCPKHAAALVESAVRPDLHQGSPKFTSLEEVCTGTPVQLSEEERQRLIPIAQGIRWLLDHPINGPGLAQLHELYRRRAHGRGFRQKNGSVAISRLRESVEAFYGRRLLEQISCEIPGRHCDWVATLPRKPRGSHQPIQHLLLMHFLGLSVSEALREATTCIPRTSATRPHVHRIRSGDRLKRLLSAKRKLWLNELATSNTSARSSAPSLYFWLWRNDRTWLHEHRGPRPVRQSDHSQWHDRDERLAAGVPKIARELRAAVPPIRASRSMIASRSGRRAWLIRDHPLLPRTNAALRISSEGAVDFALRRIAGEVAMHGPFDKPWRLRVASGISTSLVRHPDVARALGCDRD